MARGRHVTRRRTRGAVIVGAIAAVFVLLAGGAAYAAYRYEMANADRILPGVTVGGVDVGGLTKAEALEVVEEAIAPDLHEPIILRLGDRTWTATTGELGRRALVASAVTQAFDTNRGLGTFDRFWHRFRDEPIGADIEVGYETRGQGAARLVGEIADEVYRPARDASMGITDDHGDIRQVPSKAGVKLARTAAERKILLAMERGKRQVELGTVPVAAKVTAKNLGPTIVVRVNSNQLELYDGFDLVKTYAVATAKPGYTTPSGVWTIWDKRENPTWYNPALDSWGASMPAVVPGGPGNPMGTRAIYIDAPGLIRIHGTTDPSSIGRYASHGCIRMQNEEVEDLFERVAVGTHVIVVGSRPAGAAYWDTPGDADI
jgi:lipoprotein-anchoring transpeptidase ErfK/SrfK